MTMRLFSRLSLHLMIIYVAWALFGCTTEETHVGAGKANVPVDLPLTVVKSALPEDTTIIDPPKLEGTWRSEKPEASGNGRYATRELKISGERWSLIYTLANGKNMQNILFTHRASGTLSLQKSSQRISGAYLVAYHFIHKSINIVTADRNILKENGLDSCTSSIGQELDISSRGCGIIPKIGECPSDYDLIRQENRHGSQFLAIGNKFAEFSSCSEEKRPVALGLSLIKFNNYQNFC